LRCEEPASRRDFGNARLRCRWCDFNLTNGELGKSTAGPRDGERERSQRGVAQNNFQFRQNLSRFGQFGESKIQQWLGRNSAWTGFTNNASGKGYLLWMTNYDREMKAR
jgi:hypothetical protein